MTGCEMIVSAGTLGAARGFWIGIADDGYVDSVRLIPGNPHDGDSGQFQKY